MIIIYVLMTWLLGSNHLQVSFFVAVLLLFRSKIISPREEANLPLNSLISNTGLCCILRFFGDCITFNFWDFLVGNIYKPAAGSHFVLLYIHRLARWIKRHMTSRSTNQVAGNSLFSSEIIIITEQHWLILRRIIFLKQLLRCSFSICLFLIVRRQWTEERTWPIKITHSQSINCTCLKESWYS